jgi:hypothetical protein
MAHPVRFMLVIAAGLENDVIRVEASTNVSAVS